MLPKKLVFHRVDTKDMDSQFLEDLNISFRTKGEVKSWEMEKLRESLRDVKNFFFVASVGETPVAYLRGYDLARFGSKKKFFIYDIETSEQFRRRGIMRALMQFVLDYLTKEGFELAWLLTTRSNEDAIALYKNAGGKMTNDDDALFEFGLS